MSPATSRLEKWIEGVTAVTVLAVVAALLVLGIVFYGPGVHARALHPQVRQKAEGVSP